MIFYFFCKHRCILLFFIGNINKGFSHQKQSFVNSRVKNSLQNTHTLWIPLYRQPFFVSVFSFFISFPWTASLTLVFAVSCNARPENWIFQVSTVLVQGKWLFKFSRIFLRPAQGLAALPLRLPLSELERLLHIYWSAGVMQKPLVPIDPVFLLPHLEFAFI